MNSSPSFSTDSSIFPGGKAGIIAFLAFLSAFPPLSTDMYLPSMPAMVEVFHSSEETVNLTISLFILLFAASMLFWGPLSDKYGRRPIIGCGAVVYILAGIICILSTNIWLLIIGRCLQAIGSGAIGAVAMAIVKDVFRGKLMENILSAIQCVTVIAPVCAPLLGGLLLKISSWRFIFVLLVLCGCIALIGTYFLKETLAEKKKVKFAETFKSLYFVLSHKKFTWLLIITSLPSMAFMSYLTGSSYVFINEFGVTPQEFSMFFSCIAAGNVLGPFAYIHFFASVNKKTLFAAVFIILTVNALFIFFLGHESPYAFALFCLCLGMTGNVIRPPSANILMNVLEKESGTSSSLIGSFSLLFGSFGMLSCSLPWTSFVTAIAAVSFAACGLALLLWILIGKKYV